MEGDLDNGFLVLPHFTVPGEVTAADPSPAYPKEVRFDFSSASEKSLFPGEPKITFLADEKVVYETAGQFSTSKYEDKFSEYLSLADSVSGISPNDEWQNAEDENWKQGISLHAGTSRRVGGNESLREGEVA